MPMEPEPPKIKNTGISAINDPTITRLLTDPNFRVMTDGSIWSRKDSAGNVTDIWRERKLTKHHTGYLKINYARKNLQVHRIIFAAFNGELDSSKVINHIDGNPLNNTTTNLELVTQSENNIHRFRVLKRPAVKGAAKITQTVADEMRRQVAEENLRACDLAKKYNMSKSNISSILNYKTWIKA